MKAGEASRTAVLVCEGRAVAHGLLGEGRFADPVAYELLDVAERALVDRARAAVVKGVMPETKTMKERVALEMLKANAEIMVPRTVVIDEAVAAADNGQVVVLGAGLDARAFRLDAVKDAVVFEVDQPDSQRDKQRRAKALTPVAKELRYVAVDFAKDDVNARLAAAGHDATAPTTWIWEGVVPYLTRAQVEATVQKMAARSAPGSRVVVAYVAPSLASTLGRLMAQLMGRALGSGNPFQHEPFRSSWTAPQMQALLERHGFAVVSDVSLIDAAGPGAALSRPVSGRIGRIAVAGC